MNKRTIFGAPGTGKTTYLMSLLSKELETTPAHEIAFVSYTKKGTYEGAGRAKEQFKLTAKDLSHFRTLHSLCFKNLGKNRTDMVTKTHYKLLSKTTGISFTGHYTEDYVCSNDEYLHVASMEKHNPNFARILSKNLLDKKFKYIKIQYQAMKQQLGVGDFDDLLESYLKIGTPLPVKTVFIDEAQDLTPLQWRVVFKMFREASTIYVAGDDDQAVYEWSGADVRGFLNFSKKSTVLNKSYRMPEKVFQLAQRISRDIQRRKQKVFESNGAEGVIDSHKNLRTVNLIGGELVLARTNYLLRGLSFVAAEKGLVYTLKGKLSIDKRVLAAIGAYTDFQKGKISDDVMRKYKSYFSTVSLTTPWVQTIDLPKHETRYYERVLHGDALNKPPVTFETFHSSKGSENDHVIVSSDVTKRIEAEMKENMDSELRCLYVGVTRTKNHLTILTPSGTTSYPEKYLN